MKVCVEPLQNVVLKLEIVLAVLLEALWHFKLVIGCTTSWRRTATVRSLELSKVELLIRCCVVLIEVQTRLLWHDAHSLDAVLESFATGV